MAILNPLDNILQEETDIKIKIKKVKKEDYKDLPIEKQLRNAILYGDADNIVEIIDNSLKKIKAMQWQLIRE